MKPWKVLNRQQLFGSAIFSLNVEECQLSDGRVMPRYYSLDFPDWVHVIPVTKAKEIILIRQYRHPAESVFWEFPGGTSDPHRHESMMAAALRELLEETGYSSTNMDLVASHFPNPALQTNQIHTFIAWDCEKVAEPNLDPFEELEFQLKSWDEMLNIFYNPMGHHSLMVASLAMARTKLEKVLGSANR
jgi:ADP-ribose pyrophosphatase